MVVMIVWNGVLSRALARGLLPSQIGGALHQRLLLLWAVALTTFLSALIVKAARLRQRLEQQQDAQARETAGMPTNDEPGLSGTSSSPGFLKAIEERVNQRAAAIQLLNLGEATFGWVSGCAWTDAVVALFGDYLFASSRGGARPTLSTLLVNAAIAAAFTAAASVWMVVTGEDVNLDEREKRDRGAIERFFVANGLSFFAGWSWVVVARHLANLVGRQLSGDGVTGE
eukprot:2289976-Prymnesium_polylepis.1